MALTIGQKLIGLLTPGNSQPEPSSFAFAQDVVFASLDEAGLIDVTKSNTEPSDKTKLWAASGGDPMTTPAVLKIPVDDAFVAASGDNFASSYVREAAV